VLRKTRQLRQGPDDHFNVDVGAMTFENQLAVVERHVDEAIARGARVRCGGRRRTGLRGIFYEPTVLTDLDHSFALFREETFGPVLPIMTFRDEAEAARLANESPYGLTASVWGRDANRARRVAEQIEAGTLTINDCVYAHALPQAPWGGVKMSGFGRTHSRIGLRELVSVTHIHRNHLPRMKDFWWYGYSEASYLQLKRLAIRLTSPSLLERLRAIPALLRAQRLPKY
jgi:succinate-semialdehyde dehydrogenase/glutarate-semialdehyde dehydrogenase